MRFDNKYIIERIAEKFKNQNINNVIIIGMYADFDDDKSQFIQYNIIAVPLLPFNNNQVRYAVFDEQDYLDGGGVGNVYRCDKLFEFENNDGMLRFKRTTEKPLVIKRNKYPIADNNFYQIREQHFYKRLGDNYASDLSYDENMCGYAVLTRYPGEQIFDKHKKFIKLPIQDRLRVIKNFILQLEFLAEHNIIHMDLKPGNVLVDFESLTVTIIDFGMSFTMQELKEQSGTVFENPFDNNSHLNKSVPKFIGTPLFAPVEILDQHNDISAARKRSDMFSAATVILTMLGIDSDDYLNLRTNGKNQLSYDYHIQPFNILEIERKELEIPVCIKESLKPLLEKMMDLDKTNRPKIRDSKHQNIETFLQKFQKIIDQWLSELVQNYAKKRDNQFNFFNRDNNKNQGQSKKEKLAAAEALKIQLDNHESLDVLNDHEKALHQGELGKIYETVKSFRGQKQLG